MEALGSHAKYMQLLLLGVFNGNWLHVDEQKKWGVKNLLFFLLKLRILPATTLLILFSERADQPQAWKKASRRQSPLSFGLANS